MNSNSKVWLFNFTFKWHGRKLLVKCKSYYVAQRTETIVTAEECRKRLSNWDKHFTEKEKLTQESGGKETQRYGKRENGVWEAGGYDPSAPPPTFCHTSKSHYCHLVDVRLLLNEDLALQDWHLQQLKIQMSLLAKTLKDSLPQFDLVIKHLSIADLFYLLDVSFFPEERGLLNLQRPQILSENEQLWNICWKN